VGYREQIHNARERSGIEPLARSLGDDAVDHRGAEVVKRRQCASAQ
jgi:hypothetical protein